MYKAIAHEFLLKNQNNNSFSHIVLNPHIKKTFNVTKKNFVSAVLRKQWIEASNVDNNIIDELTVLLLQDSPYDNIAKNTANGKIPSENYDLKHRITNVVPRVVYIYATSKCLPGTEGQIYMDMFGNVSKRDTISKNSSIKLLISDIDDLETDIQNMNKICETQLEAQYLSQRK